MAKKRSAVVLGWQEWLTMARNEAMEKAEALESQAIDLHNLVDELDEKMEEISMILSEIDNDY